jgi:diaminohydroxyphosphoribosylaminopyrimidine deaminase/5-amino-6-(5-phosphoribosylamino)uracil reductase
VKWEAWQRDLIRLALKEAAKGKGKTHPNPVVGAVVVRGRRILGKGFHRGGGLAHAEVEAIKDAGPRSKGADIYVTLEPCCHWGKTAPCTEAIVKAGIRRVFVSTLDPNPVVRGKGIRALRRAGLDVRVGLEARAGRRINESYMKFMETEKPFVTLKVAQTLDGKNATRQGESKWITSRQARSYARRMRAEAQAIMVGIGTVIKDNPGLLPSPKRKDFYRCILDTDLGIPEKSYLVQTAAEFPTIVYYSRGDGSRAHRLESKGVILKKIRHIARGLLDLSRVLDDLAERGVMHLFVEGGSAVASSFLKADLIDKLVVFVAPRIMGDANGVGSFANISVTRLSKCYGFKIDGVTRAGRDLVIVLYPERA